MAIQGLTRNQETAIAIICEIGADRLYQIDAEIKAASLIIDRGEIEKLIAKHTGSESGDQLARFLFGVAVGARQDGAAPSAALARIDDRLKAAPADARFAAWSDCNAALESLLASESIRASAKALEVSYDFERVYQDGRFITSVRPIYNDGRDKILGVTVVQTLRIDFSSTATGEPATISIALDRGDIERLRRSCVEALRKGEIASKTALESWALPTLVPGDDVP